MASRRVCVPGSVKFNARPIDKRWMPVVEEIYNWHYANERYLRNEKNLARVAIVYSQQTAAYYGGTKAREKGGRSCARILSEL